MKIYLDISCLNRPFGDQSQARIHMESEAVLLILDEIDHGLWEQVSSRMAEIEFWLSETIHGDGVWSNSSQRVK